MVDFFHKWQNIAAMHNKKLISNFIAVFFMV